MIAEASDDGERSEASLAALRRQLDGWAAELGFDALAVTGTRLDDAAAHLDEWLASGMHGTMDYMARHADLRRQPDALVPQTIRVISVRMNYWPGDAEPALDVLENPNLGYVSRYALGRDYHKMMRQRLQRLADRMQAAIGPFGYRALVDSAPVMEKPLAAMAGLGWQGKHTNLISRDAGSWFFLGELYTDLPLPEDAPKRGHCGACTACMVACPTNAITAAHRLDARLCVSYLTIEHHGAIPLALRPAMGNRIYGCDDCQLVCPWNRFAPDSPLPDHQVRNGLDNTDLAALFGWSAGEFEQRLAGSAIRRIGHERWLRNIAVALGNAPTSDPVVRALRARSRHPSALVREHVDWALDRHGIPRA
jgi:epoxyqueuosine reductase